MVMTTCVFITGANGFIGSALSERLLAGGEYEVHGMDLRSNYIEHLLGRLHVAREQRDAAEIELAGQRHELRGYRGTGQTPEQE